MPDDAPPPGPVPPRGRFPWRTVFHRSHTALFVVGPTRRLRYANPAWEAVTGKKLSDLRGMRITTTRSGSPLGQALAVPPEAWNGKPVTVRRSIPPRSDGPPWWDVSYTPVMGDGRPLAVVGSITLAGEPPVKGGFRLPAAVGTLRGELAGAFGFDLLAGTSEASERLLAQARFAATTVAPLWLTGEAGSGKRTVARIVHHHGPTRERAFVAVDSAGLPGYLLEMQLFGRGGLAYGGHLGTVYLRDPAALPRELQERLVTLFTVPRPKAPRLICGSTTPAAELVTAGTLLPRFHTALSVLEVRVPSLRDRLAELPRLADRLLQRFIPAPRPSPLAPDLLDVLRAYPWTGNLRELADVLQAAVAKAGDSLVSVDHLPRRLRERLLAGGPPREKSPSLDAVLEAVERRMIQHALAQANGAQAAAATRLGIPRARMWRRAVALGLAADDKGTP